MTKFAPGSCRRTSLHIHATKTEGFRTKGARNRLLSKLGQCRFDDGKLNDKSMARAGFRLTYKHFILANPYDEALQASEVVCEWPGSYDARNNFCSMPRAPPCVIILLAIQTFLCSFLFLLLRKKVTINAQHNDKGDQWRWKEIWWGDRPYARENSCETITAE